MITATPIIPELAEGATPVAAATAPGGDGK
jgi:hypothetical protein